VLISPFVQPGTVNATPYNHYSFLRSIEDVFGLQHIGFAAAAGLKAFGSDVFTRTPLAPTSATATPTTAAGAVRAGRGLPSTGGGAAAALAATAALATWLTVQRVRRSTP
jgi:hypothetical protein